MERKKVLVVDDSFVMRTVIKNLIAADPELEVVGEAANGEEALAQAKVLKPDVVLLDIEMPVMSGLDCMKRLRLISRAKVVIVSSVAQLGSPESLTARSLGAADIIAKPSGAMSLDLAERKGHEIVTATRRAAGLTAGP